MMSIYDALERIEAVQMGLSVTRPHEERIRTVHTLPPDAKGLGTLPCIINTARLNPTVFSSGLLQRNYTIRMQLLAGRVSHRNSLLAVAFEGEIIRAFAEDVTLKGAVTNLREIRATDGTDGLTRLEWNGLGYSGLDYEMDVWIAEAMEYAP